MLKVLIRNLEDMENRTPLVVIYIRIEVVGKQGLEKEAEIAFWKDWRKHGRSEQTSKPLPKVETFPDNAQQNAMPANNWFGWGKNELP